MSLVQEQVIREWLDRNDEATLIALLLSPRANQIATFQAFTAQLQAEAQSRLDGQAAVASSLQTKINSLTGAF